MLQSCRRQRSSEHTGQAHCHLTCHWRCKAASGNGRFPCCSPPGNVALVLWPFLLQFFKRGQSLLSKPSCVRVFCCFDYFFESSLDLLSLVHALALQQCQEIGIT